MSFFYIFFFFVVANRQVRTPDQNTNEQDEWSIEVDVYLWDQTWWSKKEWVGGEISIRTQIDKSEHHTYTNQQDEWSIEVNVWKKIDWSVWAGNKEKFTRVFELVNQKSSEDSVGKEKNWIWKGEEVFIYV